MKEKYLRKYHRIMGVVLMGVVLMGVVLQFLL